MKRQDKAAFILDQAQKRGADKVACGLSRQIKTELSSELGEPTLMRQLATDGARITVIKDQKKGSVKSNQLDDISLIKAVEEALAAADNATPDEAADIAALEQNGSFAFGEAAIDRNLLYDSLTGFLAETAAQFPLVRHESSSTWHKAVQYYYANSNGVELAQSTGHNYFTTLYCAVEGERTSSFNYFTLAFDRENERIMAQDGVQAMLEEAGRLIDTRSLTGTRQGTVILTPAALGYLLSALEHVFLADLALIRRSTPWLGKRGQKVAHESLTLVSDPLNERLKVRSALTGDGYLARPHTLIERGVLQNYSLSRYGAAATKEERSGNTGGVFFVTAGETGLAELIGKTRQGLLIDRLSGDLPAPNGDFSAVAKNSFLIENGQIGSGLSETMISGNLADLVQQVSGISRETRNTGLSELPWMRFEGVHMTGK